MYKIATHDSATGEQGKGFISWLLTPFAKTQSKTIKEQYDAGCRMFDIRVKQFGNTYRCAHGIWKSKRYAYDIIKEINGFEERCYVCLTYEGRLETNSKMDSFCSFVAILQYNYTNIKWGPVAVKYTDKDIKVDWENIVPAKEWHKNEQAFLPLNGKTWHILLPIPWLWNQIYTRKKKFNTHTFKFVDFL